MDRQERKLKFNELLSAALPVVAKQHLEPIPFESKEDKPGFREGSAYALGHLGTLALDAPFAVKDLIEDAGEFISDKAVETFAGEEAVEELREARKETSLGIRENLLDLKKQAQDYINETTTIDGLDDFIDEDGVNIAASAGSLTGGLAGGAAITMMPGVGASSETSISNNILKGLSKLGLTKNAKSALTSTLVSRGAANTIAGAPLTVAAAQDEEGNINPEDLATGLLIDGIAGSIFAGASISTKKGARDALKTVSKLTRNLSKRTSIAQDALVKQRQARDFVKKEEAEFRTITKPQELEADKIKVADNLANSNESISTDANKILKTGDFIEDKVEDSTNKIFQKVREGYAARGVEKDTPILDTILQPLSSRISKISPVLRGALREFEFNSLLKPREYIKQTEPFLRKLKLIRPEDKKLLKRYLGNGDNNNVKRLLSKYEAGKTQGISEDFEHVGNVLGDIYTKANDAGMDVGHMQNYFPRQVKDYDKLAEHLDFNTKKDLQTLFSEKALELKRDLSPNEKSEITNKFLMQRRQSSKLGFTKARKIDTLDGLEDFYQEPEEALLRYINGMSQEIEARNFLGKGNDLNTSIGHKVSQLSDEGLIKAEDEQRLIELLQARFLNNKKSAMPIFNKLRNVVYASTIGNPISTITQFSDLALSAYRNGLFETIGAMVTPKKIKIEDIGVDDIAAELGDPDNASKFLNKLFDVTGFKAIDKLGKETNINAAYKQLRKAAKAAPDSKQFQELIEEQVSVFGQKEQLQDLVSALRNDDPLNENVRLAVFNRLSETQPISLSEMPQAYIENPNGRIIYALKSFTLKQLDMQRQRFINRITRAKIAKEAASGVADYAKFVTLFGGATLGVNEAKDWILGRETKLPDAMMDSALQTLGMSKYNIYRFRTTDPSKAILDFFIPPFQMLLDDPVADLTGMYTGELTNPLKARSVKNVPAVGKVIYWKVGGGRDKELRKRLKGDPRSLTSKERKEAKRLQRKRSKWLKKKRRDKARAERKKRRKR